MKRILPFAAAAIAALFGGFQASAAPVGVEELSKQMNEGDLIFIQSMTSQSAAIRAVTKSPWSHVGMVVGSGENLRIVEAGPRGVAVTSLPDFVGRSRDRQVAVHRVPDAASNGKLRASLETAVRKHLGKNYDGKFQWDDGRLYCSELVWKGYRDGLGICISEPVAFGKLELTSPAAQALLKKRYGMTLAQFQKSEFKDEPIVTPAAMKEAANLASVFEGKVGS